MKKYSTITEEFVNSRLDRWFRRNILDIPQSLLEKNIRKGNIKINNLKKPSSYKLKISDKITFQGKNLKPNKHKLKNIPYRPSKNEVLFSSSLFIENNENFAVINKPAGIAVQSGTKSFKNIIDVLKDTKYFANYKPYIVHRLDKETSGVLIVAKTREYAQLFTSLFRIRKIHKTYVALTYGKISKSKDTLKDDLVSYDNNKKIIQKAISHLKVLKSSDNYSYVELNPITGRKHQLRKQLYNIGNPIVGDDKYFIDRKANKKKTKSRNLMLHAYKIKFMINNIQYNFKAKYNKDFEEFLKRQF